jgi:hypothetical protein
VPEVSDREWPESPIDRFVLRDLEAAGLRPAPAAAKPHLLRRVHYDLTGLPPSIEDLRAFLADESPGAFARVVDRLLASPRHGEKWGRHWLDLVAYAESNGYERDSEKLMAWRYRDYAIDALNDDKPYDRFVSEQLAGDELDEVTAEGIIATGYYRLGLWDDEPADPTLARYDYLDGIARTTGEVMLGLTIGCARCHDHKIDPLPARDYYRFLAFFHRVSPHGKDGANLVPVATEAEERFGCEGKAMAVAERGKEPTRILLRGNPGLQGDEVLPGFPEALAPPEPRITARAGSSGRRRALAAWITSRENPLTARVIVNRLWQHHFGRGIVRSASDFGRGGDRPTHPELLDWLASDLVESGWRLKALHRRLLLSRTYQMSSRAEPEGLARDPENDLFWRFGMRRLTAEEIRDSMLLAAGRLNLEMGGPSMYPELPHEVLATSSTGAEKWGKSRLEETWKRSVYAFVRRSLQDPMLTVFDLADTDAPCAVRFSTTVPTQALTLLNSGFVNEQAAALAARLRAEAGDDSRARVRRAFEIALSRDPSAREVEDGLRALEDLVDEGGASPEGALERFALLVLNLSELLFVD